MAFVPVSTEQTVTVEEHVARILAAVEPLPPYDQPLLDALGLPVCEDVSLADGPSGLRQLGHGRLRRDDRATSRAPPRTTRAPSGRGRGRPPDRRKLFAMSPGTAVKIMTGAPVPPGADADRPGRVDRRRRRDGAGLREPKAGQHVRRRARTSRRATCCSRTARCSARGSSALMASVGRAQVRSRPRPRVVIMSTGAELREPGVRLAHDAIYDSNSFMLAAAVRNAGAIAYRVGIVSDDPAEFARRALGPAGPRRRRDHQRRRQQGRVRRRQGGAVRAGHRLVRRGPDAAGQAAGVRARRRGPHADLRAARQPRVGVRLVRAVRAARAAPDDGPRAVPPAPAPAQARRTVPLRHGQGAVRPRALRADERGGHVDARRGPRLAPARRPLRANALIVVPAETEVVETGSDVDVLLLDRDF